MEVVAGRRLCWSSEASLSPRSCQVKILVRHKEATKITPFLRRERTQKDEGENAITLKAAQEESSPSLPQENISCACEEPQLGTEEMVGCNPGWSRWLCSPRAALAVGPGFCPESP